MVNKYVSPTVLLCGPLIGLFCREELKIENNNIHISKKNQCIKIRNFTEKKRFKIMSLYQVVLKFKIVYMHMEFRLLLSF